MSLQIPKEIEAFIYTILAPIFLLLIILIAVLETISYLKERSKRKFLEKHPELTEKLVKPIETKKKIVKIPDVIPKKVKVVILSPERQMEMTGKFSQDGNVIRTKLGSFTVPDNYKPRITWSGRKTFLTFYFDKDGNAIQIRENGETETIAPDPAFTRLLVDKGLVAKIFRLGIDVSSLVTGIGFGCLIIFVLLFFVLPLIGIPVTIGKTPVEINISGTSSNLPPAGNFTIPKP